MIAFKNAPQRDVALKVAQYAVLHDIDFLRNNVALKTGLCKKQSDEIVELPEVSVTGKKDNTFCGKKRNKVTNKSRKPVQYQIAG